MKTRLRLVGKSTLEDLSYRVKRLEDVVDKFFTKWLEETESNESNCPCDEDHLPND